jgi:hypothetical protein
LNVSAGQQTTITVAFLPTSVGTASGNISIVSNAAASPTSVGLSGAGIAAAYLLGANPTSLSFGNVNVGNTGSLSATLTNNGNSNVTISSVTPTGTGFSASGVASGTVLTPNQSVTLNAAFAPTAAGSVTGSVSVLSNATNSPTTVALSGTGASGAVSVSISPSSASLLSGQTQQFTATVTGSTNTAVTWSAAPGSIAILGLYTAPLVLTNTNAVVTATSVADPSKSASATVTVTGAPPGAVVISACSDIQTAVNSNPAGTTFYLQACTYRQQSISPNNGDTFLGETGAILTGSKLITTFTPSGSYWVASGQASPTIDSNSSASCMGDSPLCKYQTEVFIDDTKLKPVSSLSAVVSGTWYFNSGNIYLADNPNGHKVEVSVTTYAFNTTGSNVTLKNLIIEKYANPSQTGAVCPQQSNCSWTIDSNEIRLNHGGGIRVGSNAKVLNNYIHHNGQIGILGLGSGIVVDGNEIAFNNDAGYSYSWEAGGTKFLYTNNVIIRNNYSHDNRGPGLWTDYNNFFMTFESNRVERNKDFGIATELCMDGTIRYNYVAGTTSDFHPTRLWNNGGVGIIDTRRDHVYGNTLFNNAAGIVGVRTTRSGPLPGSGGETAALSDMDIHDNLVIQPTNIAAGAVDANDPAIYTSLNNRYRNNTYKIGSLTGNSYQWPGSMTSAQWQGAGQDSPGTWLSPTDPAFPSTKFDTGNRVKTITSADVRALPSTVDGTLLGTLSLGNLGTITKVRGPIFTGGSWWWQVHYDSGLQGWTTENSLATAP